MSPLEQRIRRWLMLYPAEQREEMLGVVLASTQPGRRRPSTVDTLNLIQGAVRIRLRREIAALDSPAWRDAFAILSLVTIFVLFSGTLGVVRDAQPPYTIFMVPPAPVWLLWLPWPLVAVLSLLGLRRAAIGLAWAAALGHIPLWALAAGRSAMIGPPIHDAFWFTLALVAAAALSSSDGLKHVAALLGRSRTVLVAVSAAVLDYALTGVPIPETSPHLPPVIVMATPSIHEPAMWLITVPLLLILAASSPPRTAPGRRHAALVLLTLSPLVIAMMIQLIGPETIVTETMLALPFFGAPLLPLTIPIVAASRRLRRRHGTS